ncbi:lactonase family protein [Rhizobium leguminosarum]|uniref:lactonase family protein n=1 Tax=Rhizobium leguminosarum TaxID=384 RepID=UPI001C965F9B|nr:lactonase family protein [Rhizobium leguminosarum]MBY5768734.1 lactonase family protein [Rhizobium leguminosarum]
MNGSILTAATLAIAFSLAAPQSMQAAEGAQAAPEILRRISASRIAVISDGDFLARTYGTAELAPRNAGYRDLLTIMSPVGEKIVTGSIPVSNSVTSAPEILALSEDGQTAFVTERLGERPKGGNRISDLPPGRRLFAVDLSDDAALRLSDTVEIEAFPEALSLSPDGESVAVVSNTPEASFVQIVAYRDGRFSRLARFDLADLGVRGSEPAPRGGVTSTNVHWHPSGRFLAVNINTQNRVAFFEVTGANDAPILRPWGNVVEVGADPFVGRFTPDGRHYLTANWGRNFTAKNLEGRIPQTPSTISVIRLADPATSPQSARHDLLGGAETGLSSEGIAISPDGQLVATVNMRGTAFPPGSARFHRDASVTLLSFDPATGAIARLADYPFEGSLPEGGAFDRTGDHFLATVFQGHDGAWPEAGPGLEVFRVAKGDRPALKRLGRVPLPHGVHHVDLAP